MLLPIERGRLNEQALIAPVLRTPAPSWPQCINGVANSAGNIGDGSYPRNLWNTLLLSTVRGRAVLLLDKIAENGTAEGGNHEDSGMFYKPSSVKIVRAHRLVEGESPQSPRLTAPVTTFYYRRPRCATVDAFMRFL